MWNEINVQQCLDAYGKKPEKILVIGCGDKCEDIKAFNKILNSDVIIHGVDILEETGRDYSAPNVLYIKADATQLPIVSEYYDIAYSFATFEHIFNIGAAWQNMLSTLKANGMLYTVSSPLWMSPYGHHKRDIFEDYPYAHLRYQTPSELTTFCKSNGILAFAGIDIVHHVNYMLNIDFFNKLDSEAYIASANNLQCCTLVRNSLDFLPETQLLGAEDLLHKGFNRQDLLALTHRLIALKNQKITAPWV